MDSYAKYRLTDWDWIPRYKQKMGTDLFREYVNNVYSELMKMHVGDRFSLDDNVREENRELFVKIVCMFIQEGNSDYDFSPDYKIVRRHEKTTMVKKPRRISSEESGENDTKRDSCRVGKNGTSC